jgi:hypothetical protein
MSLLLWIVKKVGVFFHKVPTTSVTLETLPVELKEHVYSFLNVSDRARFRVAMQKTDTHFRYKCPMEERKLGLFVRSIKKRRVSAMSFPMRQFLGTIDRDDPTLDEIAEVFPEAVANHRNNNPRLMSLAELISNGTITEEDVRARLHEDLSTLLEDWEMKETLYKCMPHHLDILLIHPDFRRFIDTHSFLYSIVNFGNEELIVYMKGDFARLGIDMPTHERSLVEYIMKSTPRSIFMTPDFIPVAIRHLPFTSDEMDLVWAKCLEEMNMDVVDEIDRFREASRIRRTG